MTALAYSLAPHWTFPPWVVLPLVVAAGALVAYLYRAQRQVASRGVVVTITIIRVLLVGLMLVVLAGLSVRWDRTASTGGTLWVLVDTSASMTLRDARATDLEKLRWADALGLLPPDVRPSKLDRQLARLTAARSNLSHLRAHHDLPGTDRAAAAASLREWADGVRATADELSKDPAGQRAGPAAVAALRDAAPTPAGNPLWGPLQAAIDRALAELRPLADAADQKLLADRAGDPTLKEALNKVSTMTRAQLAQLALSAKSPGTTSLADLVPRQATKLVTFADGPHVASVDASTGLAAALKSASGPEAGQSTDLAAALRYVHDHLDQSEPASVVVLSDGRHNSGGDVVEPARLLASRGVRVFSVASGSQEVATDAAVEQFDAPDWVYHDDTLRAAALLRLDGLAGKPVTVDFYRGGTKVDSETVRPAQDRATQVVHFSDKPPEAGVFDYEVRVAELPDEAVNENNRLGARVAVKKDKLAVLLVEDMPRWEYRHLVNYLSRDQRVKLQTVLLQPARVENVTRPPPVRASPKNVSVEAQLLPQRPQDWAAFDLVVLGDVTKEALAESDQQALVGAVRDRGTALLLIAGPFNMPQRYAGTPLEGLVPVELSAEWPPEALAAHVKGGFRPAPSPEGRSSVLSQFTLDEPSNASLWAALPAWYWHSPCTTARRSASILWSISDSGGDGADRDRSLLCTMSVGMGRVMYLASDSTWRMRQVAGQNPHERFWGQVIRWVVDNELPAGGKLIRFGTDKPRYVAGEAVVVTARLLGEDLSPLTGQKLKAVALGPAGQDAATAELKELSEAPGYYRAALQGVPAGRVELTLRGDTADRLLADPEATQKTLAIDVQTRLSVEQRNVNADRATMARVAEAGGGVCLDGPYADVIAAQVPRLNYETRRVEQAGLFTAPGDRYSRLSHWIFFAAFVVLASAEWVIRKAAGLV
jgi:hypothetical protein